MLAHKVYTQIYLNSKLRKGPSFLEMRRFLPIVDVIAAIVWARWAPQVAIMVSLVDIKSVVLVVGETLPDKLFAAVGDLGFVWEMDLPRI